MTWLPKVQSTTESTTYVKLAAQLPRPLFRIFWMCGTCQPDPDPDPDPDPENGVCRPGREEKQHGPSKASSCSSGTKPADSAS
ncbi:hypothetical protein HYALB_00004162 [Hymenoscyphus albidus]|uniref:Uncharacterized protein n=1 Tax=Hymenoscyphus albidus TaxID=595503 RepID=A0A9N9LN20_9HELO|nr:hypothetical protein HYALB_00004162 [Hymenoscyphus albidus]